MRRVVLALLVLASTSSCSKARRDCDDLAPSLVKVKGALDTPVAPDDSSGALTRDTEVAADCQELARAVSNGDMKAPALVEVGARASALAGAIVDARQATAEVASAFGASSPDTSTNLSVERAAEKVLMYCAKKKAACEDVLPVLKKFADAAGDPKTIAPLADDLARVRVLDDELAGDIRALEGAVRDEAATLAALESKRNKLAAALERRTKAWQAKTDAEAALRAALEAAAKTCR